MFDSEEEGCQEIPLFLGHRELFHHIIVGIQFQSRWNVSREDEELSGHKIILAINVGPDHFRQTGQDFYLHHNAVEIVIEWFIQTLLSWICLEAYYVGIIQYLTRCNYFVCVFNHILGIEFHLWNGVSRLNQISVTFSNLQSSPTIVIPRINLSIESIYHNFQILFFGIKII